MHGYYKMIMKSSLMTIKKFGFAVLKQQYKGFLSETLKQAQEQIIYQPYQLLLSIQKFNSPEFLVIFQKGLFVEDENKEQFQMIQSYFSLSMSITQELYKLVWSENVRQMRIGISFIHRLGQLQKPDKQLYFRFLENYFKILKTTSSQDKLQSLNTKNYLFLSQYNIKQLIHKNVVEIIQQHCSIGEQLSSQTLFFIFEGMLFNRLDFPILYQTLFNKIFPKLNAKTVHDIAIELSILYNLTNQLPQFYVQNLIQNLSTIQNFTHSQQLQIHNIIFQLRRNFKVKNFDEKFVKILSNLQQINKTNVQSIADEEFESLKQIKTIYTQICRKLNIQDKMKVQKEWPQLQYNTKYFRSVLNSSQLYSGSQKFSNYVKEQENLNMFYTNPLFGDNLPQLLHNIEQKQVSLSFNDKMKSLKNFIQNNLKNPKQIIDNISQTQTQHFQYPELLLCSQIFNSSINLPYQFTIKKLILYIASNPYIYTKIVMTPICRYMLTKFQTYQKIKVETNYWEFPYFYHFKLTIDGKILLIYLTSPLLCDKYLPNNNNNTSQRYVHIQSIQNYLNIIQLVKTRMKKINKNNKLVQ